MGRITPSPRRLYEETIGELKAHYQSSLVDPGHREAFNLLLREAWGAEQAAMANSNIPVVMDRLNLTANLHNRKLIGLLLKEIEEKERAIQSLREEVARIKALLATPARRPGGVGGGT